MTAEELLAYLFQQGIDLCLEGDKLRYRGAKGTLPPSFIALLKQHNTELRRLLRDGKQGDFEQFPLSYTQKALWFLFKLHPSSSASIGSIAISLHGVLSLHAFHRAFELLCMRHAALRVRLLLRNEVPWQRVESKPTTAVAVFDTKAEAASDFAARLQAEALRPFDLLNDPPIRLHLYQREPDHFVLFLSMPHIHADGWSLAILIRELSILYGFVATGQPVGLPLLSADYSAFVRWQQQVVLSAKGEAKLQYWLNAIADAPAVLHLPTDRPRPPACTERGAALTWTIDLATTERIKAAATKEQTTPYVLLLGAFALLLHRYTAQNDFLIGSPFHGRTDPKFNSVVGCFVNSLALRVRFRKEGSFSSLVAALHETVAQALPCADYPFPLLVERLHPKRNPSRTPLFQTFFTYENFQGFDIVAAAMADFAQSSKPQILFDVPVEPFPRKPMQGQFDLSLTAIECAGEIRCSLSYCTDLFDASTIQRMAQHYMQILRSALFDPTQMVSTLPMLLAEEQDQLVVAWNQTNIVFPEEGCIHHRFVSQAQRTPDALAVIYQDQSLTYRELHVRTDHLSQRLRTLGVRPEVCVGLFVERSLDIIVGILAILKAGGAYVPIDPSLPAERIAFILKDTAAPVVVTQPALCHKLPQSAAVVLTAEADNPCNEVSADGPELSTNADNLAYVIYTSGSTGRPRGVLITHRSAMNLWSALSREIYEGLPILDRALRISVNASIWSDSSIKMLIQVLSGHTLCIVPMEAHRESAALVRFVREERIDVLDCTPSQARLLFDAGLLDAQNFCPQRVLVGGEAISEALWQTMRQSKEVVFVNVYGPPECTVDATACVIKEDMAVARIGRPLANVQIYLLDQKGNPVPILVSGEIYIGGVGVGRGYLNQAQRTAEHFVPDPFSGQPGARIYRTGEMGRYLPDGSIEFLGRMDQSLGGSSIARAIPESL